MYTPKGNLQKVINVELKNGNSPRRGQIAVITLACGHTIQRCAGFYRGKRIHCFICHPLNYATNSKL